MKKKTLVIFSVVLVMSLSLLSVAYGADTYKTLKAWFGDLKIYANGQLVKSADPSIQPFIVDGTTYVPLRMISTTLNKNVAWDGTNKRIDITDKPDDTKIFLFQQLVAKDERIQELEAQIKMLQGQAGSGTNYDLNDLEDDLNYDYSEYENLDFDIELWGDEDDIEVGIYITNYSYYRWSNLSSTELENYLQDIVDDILDEFEDADIIGYMEDEDNGNELLTFTISSRGNVNISESGYDLDDLEDELNQDFGQYKNVDFDIDLSGDEDEMQLDIYVDLARDGDEWDNLTEREIEYYLDEICEDIFDEYPDAYIEGTIEDEDNSYLLVTFDAEIDYGVYIDYIR